MEVKGERECVEGTVGTGLEERPLKREECA